MSTTTNKAIMLANQILPITIKGQANLTMKLRKGQGHRLPHSMHKLRLGSPALCTKHDRNTAVPPHKNDGFSTRRRQAASA
eukprot:2963904-Amphidinium_carterae.1